MKLDLANDMSKILNSKEYRETFERPSAKIEKTASVKNVVKEERITKYEACVRGLINISRLLDHAGLSKSSTLALISLDSLIKEAQDTMAISDENDALPISVKDWASSVEEEDIPETYDPELPEEAYEQFMSGVKPQFSELKTYINPSEITEVPSEELPSEDEWKTASISDVRNELRAFAAKEKSKSEFIFSPEKSKDKKGHFPIDTIGRARNALAQVEKFEEAPPWYKGTLTSLKNSVKRAVHEKYPSIGKDSDNAKDKKSLKKDKCNPKDKCNVKDKCGPKDKCNPKDKKVKIKDKK